MSLLSNIAHVVGNVATPIEEAGGAITSVGGLLKNPVSNALTNTGHAFSNQNFSPFASGPTNYAVSQPTFQQAAPLDTSGSSGSGSDTSGFSSASLALGPAVNPNQSYIDLINGAIDRLPGQLQTADANIQNQFNTNNNQLDSSKAQAQQGYNQSTAQNGQQYVTNKNQISSQASNGLHGILALLGAHGAGGSSAAQYAAPNAVSQVATQQRAGAGQTFGQNQQALDTNWGNYQTGFDNSKKQLADWLTQQNNAAQSTSEQTKQGLLQQLLGLQTSTAAAQPYVDQINASANQVDQLANFNPTYNGTTPTYTAPNIASYTLNQTGAPVLGTAGDNTAASSPLQFLLGLKDKQLQPSF